MSLAFQEFFQQCQQRVNHALENVLPDVKEIPTHLHTAMRYSVLEGGKRIRPALIYAAGEVTHAPTKIMDAAACAIELIHAYSLVHDDLPAMDNDTLRRGKPTCHVAFGEATAILVGDALQSLAFECLADTKLIMLKELAEAAGSKGMVGGQQIDISHVGKKLELHALKQMHKYKTGALIVAAVRLGALAGEVKPAELEALTTYAKHVGLAFQVHDDILDAQSTTEILGKTAGADAAQDKPTYTQILGVTPAIHYANELHEQALAALEPFDSRADHLRALAGYTVNRKY